jgi:hypothetical protein
VRTCFNSYYKEFKELLQIQYRENCFENLNIHVVHWDQWATKSLEVHYILQIFYIRPHVCHWLVSSSLGGEGPCWFEQPTQEVGRYADAPSVFEHHQNMNLWIAKLLCTLSLSPTFTSIKWREFALQNMLRKLRHLKGHDDGIYRVIQKKSYASNSLHWKANFASTILWFFCARKGCELRQTRDMNEWYTTTSFYAFISLLN